MKALDVAKYIIHHEYLNNREVDNIRLQRLLYFAWLKVFAETGEAAFEDEVEAWESGVVIPTVYFNFKLFGSWDIDIAVDDMCCIDENVKKHIDSIIDYCKDYPTFQLTKIICKQTPYKTARRSGISVISKQSMKNFVENHPNN